MLKQQFNHSNISNLYFDRRSDLVSKDYFKLTIKQNINDDYIMKWHKEMNSVVISYGQTEPLNTIMELNI